MFLSFLVVIIFYFCRIERNTNSYNISWLGGGVAERVLMTCTACVSSEFDETIVTTVVHERAISVPTGSCVGSRRVLSTASPIHPPSTTCLINRRTLVLFNNIQTVTEEDLHLFPVGVPVVRCTRYDVFVIYYSLVKTVGKEGKSTRDSAINRYLSEKGLESLDIRG